MAKKPSADVGSEQHRLEGFKALADSAKSNSYQVGDTHGEYRYWKDLSVAGKVGHIVRDAAYYNVPFHAFAQEVRDTLGHLPPEAREEAALRVAFEAEGELYKLGKLLPEHNRLEEYPLIDRLRDTLDDYRQAVSALEDEAKIGRAFQETVAQAASSAPLKDQVFGATPTAQSMVLFKGFECEVEQTTYANGRTALILLDAKDREQVAVATVNLPDVPLKPGEVFIKDYSENQGMLAALEKAGIVKATGETVRSGFVEVPVVKVLQPHITATLRDQLFAKEPPAPQPQPEQPHKQQHKL